MLYNDPYSSTVQYNNPYCMIRASEGVDRSLEEDVTCACKNIWLPTSMQNKHVLYTFDRHVIVMINAAQPLVLESHKVKSSKLIQREAVQYSHPAHCNKCSLHADLWLVVRLGGV